MGTGHGVPMGLTEADHRNLYTDLVRVLGARSAETLMDHLPTASHEELATKAKGRR